MLCIIVDGGGCGVCVRVKMKVSKNRKCSQVEGSIEKERK